MDFKHTEILINGIHHTLAENQALIEEENGQRNSGYPYVYSIVKAYNREKEGVRYTLVLDFPLRANNIVVRMKNFFMNVRSLVSEMHPFLHTSVRKKISRMISGSLISIIRFSKHPTRLICQS